MSRRAFTLVEVLLAVFILGIGIISVSALFPVGIVQQRASNDDALGPVVAQHALDVIRGKVVQDDFGTFEEYYTFDFGQSAPTTIRGDWSWKRPAIYFDQQVPGVGLAGPGEDDRGVIDIFGVLCRRGEVVNFASEFGDDPSDQGGLLGGNSPLNRLYGIPANRRKWDPDNNVNTPLWLDLDFDGLQDPNELREPLFLVTQQERYWPSVPSVPQGAVGSGTPSAAARPQFVWDCMFRRFEGRILVAVFVYRVGTTSGAEPRPYRVAKGGTGGPGFPPAPADRPPMPRLGAFVVGAPEAALALSTISAPRASGRDGNLATLADNAIVPDTDPGGPAGFNIAYDAFSWQAPNQLWLDQWNDIHRVVAGRRTNSDGPVTLARPVTTKPSTAVLFSYGPNGLSNVDPGQLELMWYLPIEDANGVAITPVYITVMEL